MIVFKSGGSAFFRIVIIVILTNASAMTPPTRSLANTNVKDTEAAKRYKATDLGLPNVGTSWVEAHGISPNGRYVVGAFNSGRGNRAFIWTAGTFVTLADQYSAAWAVNDAGTVVGNVVRNSLTDHAVEWKDGKMYEIFSGDLRGRATSIDNAENIYGTCLDDKGARVWRPFLRRSDGTTQYFDADDAQNSYLQCANAKGQVVINRVSGGSVGAHLVLWDGKSYSDLPSPLAGEKCQARAMNDTQDVVGYISQQGKTLPVVWRAGKPGILPLPNRHSGWAMGVNHYSQVVGTAWSVRGSAYPFLASGNKITPIEDLLINRVSLKDALAINDQGVILAVGYVDKNKMHSYLLVPNKRF